MNKNILLNIVENRCPANQLRMPINLIPISKISDSQYHKILGSGYKYDHSLLKYNTTNAHYPSEIKNIRQEFVVVLQSLQKKFFAFIDPSHSTEQVVKLISTNIENLRREARHSYDGVVGLITGGIHYYGNPNRDKSIKLMDELYETITQKENIPTTVLAEQKIDFKKSANSGMDLWSRTKNVYLYNGIIKTLKGQETSNPAEAEKVVDQAFDYVEVSPFAPLNIVKTYQNLE